MTENHPITPTQELVREWAKGCSPYDIPADHIARCAARWGADQQLKLDIEQVNRAWQKGADHELEACCEWLIAHYWKAASEQLRATRRPKPPSLKERLAAAIEEGDERTALRLLNEALPD